MGCKPKDFNCSHDYENKKDRDSASSSGGGLCLLDAGNGFIQGVKGRRASSSHPKRNGAALTVRRKTLAKEQAQGDKARSV